MCFAWPLCLCSAAGPSAMPKTSRQTLPCSLCAVIKQSSSNTSNFVSHRGSCSQQGFGDSASGRNTSRSSAGSAGCPLTDFDIQPTHLNPTDFWYPSFSSDPQSMQRPDWKAVGAELSGKLELAIAAGQVTQVFRSRLP